MISVVVPARNAAKHIGRCLQALLQQRDVEEDYELIVVDDGSTDSTGSVARGLGVRVLTQPHQGPGAARNYGAREARGSLLLFTDADCEPDPWWISRMVGAFARQDIVGAKGAYRSRQRSLIARFVQLEFEDKYDHLRKSEYTDFVDTYAAGYRRDEFLASGGFDAGFRRTSLEDQDLSFRLAAQGYKMIFVPDAVVYHQHPDTLIAYLDRKFWVGYWKVLINKRHPSKALSDSRTPPSLRWQVALAGLFFPTVVASLATSWLLFAFAFFLFLLTTGPFTIKALRKDAAVGMAAPFLLLARAVSLGVGYVAGKTSVVRPETTP